MKLSVIWPQTRSVRNAIALAVVAQHTERIGLGTSSADELIVSPIGCGPDPRANLDDLLEVLGELARS